MYTVSQKYETDVAHYNFERRRSTNFKYFWQRHRKSTPYVG